MTDLNTRPWDPVAEAGEGPIVTVAVATHQRTAGLRALLRALEAQTLPSHRFEVMIVDDASADDTPQVLAEEASRSPLTLRFSRFETNRGPAAARNEAWRRGTAPIVAFTDDDCLPEPTWLEAALDDLKRGPCVLVGATEPDPTQRHLLDPLARTMHVIHAKFAPTCNVFYLRDDLVKVGGFDETFRVPVGEDTDLAWRISRDCGRELRFCKTSLVYHDVRVRTLSHALRETRRWAGIPPVVARHREMARDAWHRGYWLRPSHPRALLALLGLFVTPVFPLGIVLTLPWLRYRIFPGRPSSKWVKNVRFAPGAFLIDLYEIYVLAKGSIKHRALIL